MRVQTRVMERGERVDASTGGSTIDDCRIVCVNAPEIKNGSVE